MYQIVQSVFVDHVVVDVMGQQLFNGGNKAQAEPKCQYELFIGK